MAQPALPLVEKLIYRAEKYKVELPMADVESASQQLQSAPSEETVGQALAAIIALAHQHGIDPESSLRGHARATHGARNRRLSRPDTLRGRALKTARIRAGVTDDD